MKKRWYDYLWIASLLYLVLGFFNILFAWLGLLCFFIPLAIALVKGTKGYCNRYCGRGQLFSLLGGRLGLSRKKDIPRWMKSKGFRYGFLIFFFAMFFVMLFNTYLVVCRSAGYETGGHAAMDVQTAVALGLPWDASPRRGRAVRLWFLQHDADLHCARADHDGAVQAAQLVRILPDGNDDAADLQSEGREGIAPRSHIRSRQALQPFFVDDRHHAAG